MLILCGEIGELGIRGGVGGVDGTAIGVIELGKGIGNFGLVVGNVGNKTTSCIGVQDSVLL